MSKSHQFLFWIIVALFLIVTFGQANEDYIESFYFVSFLLPVAIGTSTYFNQVLVPTYLLKRNYWKFGLYLMYSLIFSLYFEMLVLTLALIVLANYNYANLNPYSTNIIVLTSTIYLIVFIDAFILLIKQYQKKERLIKHMESEQKKNQIRQILVKVERKQVPIELDKIIFIESLSDYVKIKTESDQIVTKEKISSLSQKLPSNFIRIHRSYIVNQSKVDRFNNDQVIMSAQVVPISRTYRKDALIQLKNQTE